MNLKVTLIITCNKNQVLILGLRVESMFYRLDKSVRIGMEDEKAKNNFVEDLKKLIFWPCAENDIFAKSCNFWSLWDMPT